LIRAETDSPPENMRATQTIPVVLNKDVPSLGLALGFGVFALLLVIFTRGRLGKVD
jgi:hypothetical protein